MARSVAVVPHSHWDREWYAPFEFYRGRLVAMMDGLIDLLEADERFAHFHLDGQVAVVDDYLEVRPGAAERLQKLIAAGRIAVGPWYVLMDEFCVSAETIVRNLQLGLARMDELGAGDPVGYLPDMFGHVAQMPQLLGQAGIRHAVVWRGVPSAVAERAFLWRAPDGSTVRAEYLPVGYASGAFLPKEPPALLRRLAAHEEEIGSFLGDGPMLLMNGGDHQRPQEWLPDLIAATNASQDRFDLAVTSLAGFLADQPEDGLGAWKGELRSGARAPLLMGVLSNRVDVKVAAAVCEAALERTAEPLAALWLPPDLWPGDLLRRAWLEMIRNSAHDSICACSADPVVRAVAHRYDSALAVAADVTASAAAIAGVATAGAGWVAVNPLATSRAEVVEVEVAGAAPAPGMQVLGVTPAGVEVRTGTGADLARILGELARDGWLGPAGRGVDAEITADDPLTVTIRQDGSRPAEPGMAPVMAEVWARAGAGRHRPLVVRVERSASQRVLMLTGDVPGWGWKLLPDGEEPAHPVAVGEEGGAVTVGNGLVRVVVDGADGTFSVDGVAGYNRLVEEGDDGDTYNFSPAPGAPRSQPESTQVSVVERGPLRAVVRVARTYPWAPPTTVTSELDVRAGDPVVRVTVTLDHRGRDHRIRVVLPVGERVASTTSECAFATVTRAGAEGGPLEGALPTFPSRRFVVAGPLTVTHQGLLEHELVEGGTALAVTLLRTTGVLSRPAPSARPNVAGPPLELRDAQMPGPVTLRFAVARGGADPWELADRVWTPLVVTAAGGHGHLPAVGRRLQLSGARVSSLQRRDGALEVRVFNPSDEPATVAVEGHSGVLVDLRGVEVERWDGSFTMGPWRFATARLDAVSLD